MPCPTEEEWIEYILEQDQHESYSPLESHLSSCPACSSHVDSLVKANRAVDRYFALQSISAANPRRTTNIMTTLRTKAVSEQRSNAEDSYSIYNIEEVNEKAIGQPKIHWGFWKPAMAVASLILFLGLLGAFPKLSPVANALENWFETLSIHIAGISYSVVQPSEHMKEVIQERIGSRTEQQINKDEIEQLQTVYNDLAPGERKTAKLREDLVVQVEKWLSFPSVENLQESSSIPIPLPKLLPKDWLIAEAKSTLYAGKTLRAVQLYLPKDNLIIKQSLSESFTYNQPLSMQNNDLVQSYTSLTKELFELFCQPIYRQKTFGSPLAYFCQKDLSIPYLAIFALPKLTPINNIRLVGDFQLEKEISINGQTALLVKTSEHWPPAPNIWRLVTQAPNSEPMVQITMEARGMDEEQFTMIAKSLAWKDF